VLSLPDTVRIFVATQSVDGRRGIDGLAALVRAVLLADPLDGSLYLFFTRRLDRARLLYFARGGYWLLCRRLERGRFCLPWASTDSSSSRRIDSAQLQLILEGIDLRDARQRPRWIPAQKT
jgi:transposase